MPWNLRLIESPYLDVSRYKMKPGKGEAAAPKVGDCWFAPELLEFERNTPWHKIAPSYRRDWEGKRPPIMVLLPGYTNFCVDACAWRNAEPYGDGWTVTGEAPLLTVSPSINVGGSYHGYIQNGVITDDCEGRKFTEAGILITQ